MVISQNVAFTADDNSDPLDMESSSKSLASAECLPGETRIGSRMTDKVVTSSQYPGLRAREERRNPLSANG